MLKKQMKEEKGITLVALVVTIIILLILAGVTLSLALSDTGLLKKAQNAADRYKSEQTKEEGLLTNLEKELDKYSNGITPIDPPKEERPLVTTLTTTDHGTIKAQDKLGNPVTVPGAFKIVEGETVEDGIVIEDVNGNQFVWIPVSNIDGNNDGKGTGLITKNDGSKVEITLGRYTFRNTNFNIGSEGLDDGTPKLVQNGSQRTSDDEEYTINWKYTIGSADYKESTNLERTNGGVGANLDGFVNSVKNNNGYYLARYEASFGSGDTPTGRYGSNGTGTTSIMTNQKPVVKPTKKDNEDTVHTNSNETSIAVGDLWIYITQYDSSIVSKNMYNSGIESNYVESDLVNSYAWDTAIVYIQSMGHNNYANANCTTSGNYNTLKNTGDTRDEVCHIYDMAGNLCEWTTEYCMSTYDTLKYPCVIRGGVYHDSTFYTALRRYDTVTTNSLSLGFRPLIYIK